MRSSRTLWRCGEACMAPRCASSLVETRLRLKLLGHLCRSGYEGRLMPNGWLQLRGIGPYAVPHYPPDCGWCIRARAYMADMRIAAPIALTMSKWPKKEGKFRYRSREDWGKSWHDDRQWWGLWWSLHKAFPREFSGVLHWREVSWICSPRPASLTPMTQNWRTLKGPFQFGIPEFRRRLGNIGWVWLACGAILVMLQRLELVPARGAGRGGFCRTRFLRKHQLGRFTDKPSSELIVIGEAASTTEGAAVARLFEWNQIAAENCSQVSMSLMLDRIRFFP